MLAIPGMARPIYCFSAFHLLLRTRIFIVKYICAAALKVSCSREIFVGTCPILPNTSSVLLSRRRSLPSDFFVYRHLLKILSRPPGKKVEKS